MILVDCHCHLQDERIIAQADRCIAEARDAGVKYFLSCGTGEDDWQRLAGLKAEFGDVIIGGFGYHPWYIKNASYGWYAELDSLLPLPGSFVGEIGLDSKIETPMELQVEFFKKQFRLAMKKNMFAVLHCRQAWPQLLDCLKELIPDPPYNPGFMIHAYSGGPELITELYAYGAYFSFSGTITFSNNKKSRKSITAVSRDRLFIETDSPDMLPALLRTPESNIINVPKNIVYVLKAAAEILGISEEELSKTVLKNIWRVFNVS